MNDNSLPYMKANYVEWMRLCLALWSGQHCLAQASQPGDEREHL